MALDIFADGEYVTGDRVHIYIVVRNSHYKEWKQGAFQKKFNTKLFEPKQAWGGRHSLINGDDDVTVSKNSMIREKMKGLEEMYWKLRGMTGKEPKANDVVDTYINGFKAVVNKTFLDFFEEFKLTRDVVSDTQQVYNAIATSIRSFQNSKFGGRNVNLNEVDSAFLYRYEIYMAKSNSRAGRRYKPDTLKHYNSIVRACILYAFKTGEIDKNPLESYEFNTIINTKAMPSMAAISAWKIPPSDLHKIETVLIDASKYKNEAVSNYDKKIKFCNDLVRARLLFLLQTWTGFAYKDLEKYKDVKNLIITDLTGKKSIIYNRAKNGELALVPLFEQTACLLEALNYCINPGAYESYMSKIRDLMRYYNIDTNGAEVGTHLGRHLFGTRMLTKGFSMESISRMMGHSSMKMTESVYAVIDINKINSDYDKINFSIPDAEKIAL